ncbi:SGNH/GDSL hydrolase family protein [Actinoplanes couchii]|uniref:Lipase 1 n=1 Tax=Actinoplanes couchii TaxID=403638 RepID=A0ABQ3XTT6_9ACTN|nr:SGNH/GDSL hydrolase family protein [Actinoplanes couchii]MDR6319014.1 lysophospholipase L1-like esterase [Actinoplanes couchii]GID61917.1 lipase 1 [Actinoplanes couchii]
MRKLLSMGVAAAFTVAALALTGSPAQAAAPAGEYVALGDSYASGVGADPYDASSGVCLRSPKSYPRRLAARETGLTLKDVTCSGATIAEVRRTQLSALSANTRLVTLTVGGNDAQFTTVIRGCLTENDAYCRDLNTYVSYYARHQLVDELAALHTEVKTRAPKARIVVLGYPRLVEMTGSCGALDLNTARRTWLNGTADALAEGTSAAAQRADVEYMDTRFLFAWGAHGACGKDPWINGVNPSKVTETFHPNATGYDKAYEYAWQHLFD